MLMNSKNKPEVDCRVNKSWFIVSNVVLKVVKHKSRLRLNHFHNFFHAIFFKSQRRCKVDEAQRLLFHQLWKAIGDKLRGQFDRNFAKVPLYGIWTLLPLAHHHSLANILEIHSDHGKIFSLECFSNKPIGNTANARVKTEKGADFSPLGGAWSITRMWIYECRTSAAFSGWKVLSN